jgi:hypothetical protein
LTPVRPVSLSFVGSGSFSVQVFSSPMCGRLVQHNTAMWQNFFSFSCFIFHTRKTFFSWKR